MPIEATKENLDMLVSSNKLNVTAGWDLANGFHKPTTNWIPAGAVFTKKINNSCVVLTQTK
jgi:CRISPR-associated protein Cmr3